ncbi:MAG: hypothetical protein V4474_04390 [Patescibacteria group bacterium]
MTKIQKLLIVEDSEEFAERARKALWNTSLFPLFASSYEEALDALEHGAEFQGRRIEVHAVISDLFFPSATDWCKELFHGRILKENPSGLAIAKWCHEHRMPYILVSQGDRHKGELAILREPLKYMPFAGLDGDVLPKLLVRGGSQVDKNDPCIWLEAVIQVLQGGAE